MSDEKITIEASQLVRTKSAMELLMAENKELTQKVAKTQAGLTLSKEAAARAAQAAIELGEIREVEKAAAVEAFTQDPAAVIDLLEKVASSRDVSGGLGGPGAPDTGASHRSAHDPSQYGVMADQLWEAEFGGR